MIYKRLPAIVCNCRGCAENEELKRVYGCKKESEKMVWTADVCFTCGGTDPDCSDCNGSGGTPVHRCPHALAAEVGTLLPYYFDWHKSERCMWPDGRGRLFQPLRLAQAFDFLDSIVAQYMDEDSKRNERK